MPPPEESHVGGSSKWPSPPSPRGYNFVGTALNFRRDPLRTLLDGRRLCGDVVRFILPGVPDIYLAAHPRGIQHVLHNEPRRYRKDPTHSSQLEALAGKGLTMSEGHLWARQRQVMQPSFYPVQTATYMAHAAEATAAMLELWRGHHERGKAVDVSAEMLRLMLCVVVKSLFGVDAGRQAETLVRSSAVMLDYAYKGTRNYYSPPEWLPLPSVRRFLGARRRLDDFAYGLIQQRRDSRPERHDLLSSLLNGRDERTGEKIGEKQIRDEIVTMILAGHDTTGVALAWTFYLLARNPEAANRLREEAFEVLGDRTPTAADLPNLPYARMVLDESMRIYPPAWVLSRRSVADDVLGGYRVRAGSTILISPYVTHRHDGLWPDPEAFVPERFARAASAKRPKYAYFPFGGGVRHCIGSHFALAAAQIALVMTARAYRLVLVPGAEITPRAKLTLHPSRPVVMRLESAGPSPARPADSGIILNSRQDHG